MGRRKRGLSYNRWEAIVQLVLLALGLIAFSLGGFKTFLPNFIALVIGTGILVGGYFFLKWFIKASPIRPKSAPDAPGSTVSPGAYGETSTPAPEPSPIWNPHSILEALGEIDWYQFEKFCAALLRAEGLAVERKGGAQPDGGVDLIASREGQSKLIQCKHWRTWTVQEKVIRELLGSMTHFGVSQGAIYTLKGATRPALAFADQHGIEVVDGPALALRAHETLSPAALTDLLTPGIHHCPKCESPMVWRTGNFEPFWGCSRYPQCRGTLKHSGAK